MKKAKIMLTAIAVFAVVGGALAFKAKKVGGTVYYISTAPTTSATIPYTGSITATGTTTYFWTTKLSGTADVSTRFVSVL